MSKKCFKCHTIKPLSQFYKHSRMADGHLNKCKECNKKDVIKARNANIEYYRSYDRSRANLPHRIKKRKEVADRWKKDPKLRKIKNIQSKEWRDRNIIKRAAHLIVQNAVKRGDKKKMPCEVCGNKKSEAHHDDYSKPMDVIWLCKKHHGARHKMINEAKRNK